MGVEKEPRWQRAVPPCVPLQPSLAVLLPLPPSQLPPALPPSSARALGTTSGTPVSSGTAGWLPAPDKHISPQIPLQSLTQSLSWSPVAAGH